MDGEAFYGPRKAGGFNSPGSVRILGRSHTQDLLGENAYEPDNGAYAKDLGACLPGNIVDMRILDPISPMEPPARGWNQIFSPEHGPAVYAPQRTVSFNNSSIDTPVPLPNQPSGYQYDLEQRLEQRLGQGSAYVQPGRSSNVWPTAQPQSNILGTNQRSFVPREDCRWDSTDGLPNYIHYPLSIPTSLPQSFNHISDHSLPDGTCPTAHPTASINPQRYLPSVSVEPPDSPYPDAPLPLSAFVSRRGLQRVYQQAELEQPRMTFAHPSSGGSHPNIDIQSVPRPSGTLVPPTVSRTIVNYQPSTGSNATSPMPSTPALSYGSPMTNQYDTPPEVHTPSEESRFTCTHSSCNAPLDERTFKIRSKWKRHMDRHNKPYFCRHSHCKLERHRIGFSRPDNRNGHHNKCHRGQTCCQ